ncbi:MAG: hypothetical protein ACKV2Q_12505 [Planctomycetaceae bacterium]
MSVGTLPTVNEVVSDERLGTEKFPLIDLPCVSNLPHFFPSRLSGKS